MKTALSVLCVLWGVVLFCPGCACPRRKGETSHSVEVFAGRGDGLVAREEWRDMETGGGIFVFADPNVQAMAALHTNQTALGGGSVFSAGSMSSLVDSNLVPALNATGTAVGNVIGAAAKTAVK
ncbi:MAG TPA: hypothetical protein VH619_08880 [Verrucomicrobiae bacterium]|nr:hypothetical protein [Verrucomicrobiae bacterium]